MKKLMKRPNCIHVQPRAWRPLLANWRPTPTNLLRLLLATLCLLARPPVEAAGLGPVFQVEGGSRLATRPDGRTLMVYPANPITNGWSYPQVMVGCIPFKGQPEGPFVSFPTDIANSFSVQWPDVGVNATNGIIIYSDFVEFYGNDTSDLDIGLQFVDTNCPPNGLPKAPSWVVDSSAAWDPTFVAPRVAMNRAGQMAIVSMEQTYWADAYAGGCLLDAEGQTMACFILNDRPGSDGRFLVYNPVAAIGPDGSSVYAWEDAYLSARPIYYEGAYPARDIYARRVDAAGDPIGTQFRVNSTSNCRHTGTEIAMATNGTFVIVWQQSASEANGVYLQRFDAAANRLGPELRVSPYNGSAPQVAMAGDGRWYGKVRMVMVAASSPSVFLPTALSSASPCGSTKEWRATRPAPWWAWPMMARSS